MDAVAMLGELRHLAERRHRDPASVLRQVGELMASSDDPRVEAAGSFTAGLALQEIGRIADAAVSYRRSLDVSLSHGLVEQGALARAQLAISLLNLGEAVAAEREVVRARSSAPAPARGVVEMLYGLVLQRTGRHSEALTAYRRALRWLDPVADVTSIARLRLNRGIVYAYQGDLAAALDDLNEAERISVEQELPLLAAMAAHNIAFAQGRWGGLPDALTAFERAERAYAALETPHRLVAVLQADRCQTLLLAGLMADARAAAEAAVAALELVGDRAHLTESRLLLSRAFLAEGAYARAASEASLAAKGFRSAGWLPWLALARYVAVQAEVLSLQDVGSPPPGLLRRCRRIAVELEAQGWPVEALHVRTFIGRMALSLGRPDIARTELKQATAARRRGTADLRAQAWHATALLRLADGDTAGAKRALTSGIAVVDAYRATLGATELRANASSHGADLARLGIRLALADRRPSVVLCWAERWRAGALRSPPLRPPDDERLAAQLAQLRAVRTELVESALQGMASRAAKARASALEDEIRAFTHQLRDDRAAETGRIDVRALRSALGDRILVEYLAAGNRLHAVTVTEDRVRLHDLGPTAAVEQEKEYLLFALRRLLLGRGGPSATSAATTAAERLAGLLLTPLALPDTPAVIVPTGLLHRLPWGALPGLAGRTVTIAPSASLWLSTGRRLSVTGRGRGVALVAGPGLPGADAEVQELSRLYGDADVLRGAQATAANVLATMEKADLVHLAAHGTFRADSPLFSSVLLADGALTVYDLERLRSPPELIVLPACNAALADIRTGYELLGTAAALLGLGVRWVIAPVLPVGDQATVTLMVGLHGRLRAGERPSTALARAIAEQPDPVAAAAFVCVGGDDRPADADGKGVPSGESRYQRP